MKVDFVYSGHLVYTNKIFSGFTCEVFPVIFSRLKGFAFCYPFQAEPQHFRGVRELLEVGVWPVAFVPITGVKCGLWSQAAGALT